MKNNDIILESDKRASNIWNKPTIHFDNLYEKISYICNATDINFHTKLELIENVSYFGNTTLNESTNTTLIKQVEAMVKSFSDINPKLHQQYIPVTGLIIGNSIKFFDVESNFPAVAPAKFGELIHLDSDNLKFDFNGQIRQFPHNIHRQISMTTTILISTVDNYNKLRNYVSLAFGQDLPTMQVNEASGYIPSYAEKNDPR